MWEPRRLERSASSAAMTEMSATTTMTSANDHAGTCTHDSPGVKQNCPTLCCWFFIQQCRGRKVCPDPAASPNFATAGQTALHGVPVGTCAAIVQMQVKASKHDDHLQSTKSKIFHQRLW